jgi:hypothetical protein
MPIKSFRGKLADGEQRVINLHTNDGSTGYKVVKFEILPEVPATTTGEHVVKIFKIEQTTVPTVDPTIDFEDNTLLGCAIMGNGTNFQFSIPGAVVFDNEIFNQDIYVTHTDAHAAGACNYYIELEQVKLDLNESTVATLKDIRNITG